MIVPQQIPFSAVPVGGVFTQDSIIYFMKCDPTTQVNLANGAIATGVGAGIPCTYLPTATLTIA